MLYDEENKQIEEAINRSLLTSYQSSNISEEIDLGWLTDDNIEYILKNNEIIKQATEIEKDVQVVTEIANIHLQVKKAKDGERVDNNFWNSLDFNKRYVMLPLRVNGNHWSLLLLISYQTEEDRGKLWTVSYISSLPSSNKEIKEIKSFLQQLKTRFDSAVFNEKNLSGIILPGNPQQNNTWDCGVYLCKFIEFLCYNEVHDLDTDCDITPEKIKQFRKQWEKEIGKDKWCKWDAHKKETEQNDVTQEENEEELLQRAIELSLGKPEESTPQQLEETEEIIVYSPKKKQQQVNSQSSQEQTITEAKVVEIVKNPLVLDQN